MRNRILVAVDGSRASEAALEEAVAIARERGGALRVIHVVDSPYAYPEVLYGPTLGLAELERAWRDAGQRILGGAVARAREAGLEPESALLENGQHRISRVIVEDATRWGAGLIVLGTHGLRGVERLLLGSVAEAVARSAAVSLLLARKVEQPTASPS